MPMAFTAPILTYFRFELNPDFKDDGHGLSAELHFHHSIDRPEGENEATVGLELQINVEQEQRLENAPFWLDVEYAARFSWDEDMPQKEIEQQLRVNASAVLIGYIRPIVAMVTSSSPLPTYNLPFINVNEMFNQKKDNTPL